MSNMECLWIIPSDFKIPEVIPHTGVVVIDTLSEFLDVSTLDFGASSHLYELGVSGQNRPILTFIFDNILLVDSNANEPNSHGYIKFKATPYDTIAEFTIVHNSADIYFDFNEPVRTNDAWVSISDTVLAGCSPIKPCSN